MCVCENLNSQQIAHSFVCLFVYYKNLRCFATTHRVSHFLGESAITVGRTKYESIPQFADEQRQSADS